MLASSRTILGPALLIFSMAVLSFRQVESEPTQEKQALLDFLSGIRHSRRLNWTESSSACDWVGVICDSGRSSIITLRLPAAKLVGSIPPNTIGRLSQLRVLSLRSNRLSGQVPDDFSNLTLLRSLYLQHNALSGQFPPSVTQLTRLSRLDISWNSFSGLIPSAINNLNLLTGLFLENNNFSGSIPGINSDGLNAFNVSNNNLHGSIPASLTKFPESAFAGNLGLCGRPLSACSHKKSGSLSTAAIVGIAVGGALFLLLLLLLVLLLCCRRRQPGKPPKPPSGKGSGTRTIGTETVTSSSKDDITGSIEAAERNRLVFFNGGGYAFDLEDLLRASAEVLGKGSVGTSYKAVLEDGTTVVVKRLKEVAVNKKEFEGQMAVLGEIRHENLLPLRAYYYSKDEKLLVFDYVSAGSLSALLHGSRGSGRIPLDWDSRLKIATCAARALAHLHHSGKAVHGNLKSSNVLVRPDRTACFSDFGLNPLSSGASPAPNRLTGYRAPEVAETRKVTPKSDVYGYGVLLLELLTGKPPNQAPSIGEEGATDLPRWVQSVVREEWTAEVFDAELVSHGNVEEEMVRVLQIAMECASVVPDQRPDMAEVVRMMDEIGRGEPEDGTRQSSDEPSRGSEGHTPPQEASKTPPRGATE
ncbi:hypothetical protein SAY87_018173 [Trapa incisa]|uniref:Protein kinase domain-containing protein n=1 Tax=Trapa incisa TaxID=236973 RepID=A0AAN7L2Z5_9MYRT|nr:hypothetical protein SAY87_018173 [Trapa incisa]